MLFQRQRTLLTVLSAIGGQSNLTDFQKLLFLFTQRETVPSYEFVPYRFGCFSFTSYADKRRLIEQGYLLDDENQWQLTEKGQIAAKVRGSLAQSAFRFARETTLRGNALVAEVYQKYPYYATRSEIVDKVLSDPGDLYRIAQYRPSTSDPGLVTIGYEGKSLEAYLNQLLVSGVTLLCDVRRNPLSRKYGFSKGTLSNSCVRLGIRYEHIPALGIDSDQRRDLKTQADYDALFGEYEIESLPHQSAALATISDWIDEGYKVALTCFELHPHQCHRHCVAEAIEGARLPPLKAVHL